MKKIVVFTEGRGELIFIRHIITQIIGYEYLSFQCFDLISDSYRKASYAQDNPNATVYFEIINVGTDARVLSAIAKYHERYITSGFDIIGIRDMYSEQYKKKSNKIDSDVNKYFRDLTNDYISKLNNPEKIHLFFAIMELEAWFLGLYNIFVKVNPLLTVENIKKQLSVDLETIDPETSFFHPAIIFEKILNLAKINYDKHEKEIESFVSKITLDDIKYLIESNRCNSFASLFLEIEEKIDEAT